MQQALAALHLDARMRGIGGQRDGRGGEHSASGGEEANTANADEAWAMRWHRSARPRDT